MQQIANIWYFGFQELVNECGIGTDTLKQGVRRGSSQWVSIPDPDDRRKRLFRYDTMTLKYQALVRKNLCGGYEPGEFKEDKKDLILSERSLTDLLEIACREGFRRNLCLFEVTSGDSRYNQKRVQSLARAAAVIETVGKYILDRSIGWKSYTAFREAVQWIDANWSDFSQWKDVPSNEIRLKEKVMERFTGVTQMKDLPGAPGPKPITEVVYLKREDNQNRERYINTYPQPLAWAMQLATLGQNYSDAYIIRKVTECCEAQDIKAPSAGWFSGLFAKPMVKRLRSSYRWESGRRAERYSAYRPIEGAVNAGDCWMMDGTRVNILPHKAPDGAEKYLYMVWVYDVYSGDILGQSWCYNEDHIANINALKMAVSKAGYLPYELVFDKFPGHNTEQFGYQERGGTLTGLCKAMDEKGVKLTCTIEATGKAPIERFISTFQDVFLQESKYYYGQGVKSSRAAAHRTPQYLSDMAKEAKQEGWDFSQAWQEANHWLQSYRVTPVGDYSRKKIHQSPRDRHDESDKPLSIPLRAEQVVELFWLTKTLDIRREMVSMTVLKQDVFFPITAEAYPVLRHFDRVTVRYDETDLEGIHLFDPKTGNYLAYLEQGNKVKRYGIERPLADQERQAFLANQQAIAQLDQDELDQARAGADDIVFLSPRQNPKALRELAEDRYQAERVPEQMAARYRKPAPPIITESHGDIDIDTYIRDQY